MAVPRTLAEMTSEELRALIRAAVRAELDSPKVDAPKPAGEDPRPVQPTLEDFIELNARRARRGRRRG